MTRWVQPLFCYALFAHDQPGGSPAAPVVSSPHEGKENGIFDHPQKEDAANNPQGKIDIAPDDQKGQDQQDQTGDLVKCVSDHRF